MLKQKENRQQHKRCLQCGAEITDPKKMFCDSICRHAYDLDTWGEGRPQDVNDIEMTMTLELSVVVVRFYQTKGILPKGRTSKLPVS